MDRDEGIELDRDLVVGVPVDQSIEVQIKDALVWDESLDASGVRVWVCSGAVTLKGYVRTPEDKERAEQIASRVHGVTDVANDLKVIGETECG